MDHSTIISLLSPFLVGIFMAYFNRAQKKRDNRAAKNAAARQQESLLGLEMQFATAKLSFAVAKALQDGKVNGEIKSGIEAYEAAKKNYTDFLNRQAAENIFNLK